MVNIKLVDIHAHQFMYSDYERVYRENLKKNVRLIVENGLNYETNDKVIHIAKKYDITYYALGGHPTNIINISDIDLEKIINQIRSNKNDKKFLAIGEIGLDFYWINDHKLINIQIERFKMFLELAEELKKPVIVHSRKAEEETIDILESYNILAIMHSFWKPKLVGRIIDNEYLISVPAFVYKDKGLQKIVKETPIDLLLTETDSPFLDPIEKRNNKSWKIFYGLDTISKIKGLEIEEISNHIIKNVERTFGIHI